MTTTMLEERQDQTPKPETPSPHPPAQAEEEPQEGVNQLEVVLTAICTVSLATAWLGGRMGLVSGTPQLVLYIIAYISGGFFGTIEGLKALRRLELNVDFLMVLAAVGAASIGEWAEGATLLFLFSLSNTLQSYALERSRKAIRALMDLRPAEALVRHPDGREEMVPIEQLRIGDIVIVKPGERIPIDGVVVEGSSAVDQSPITGESIPVTKEVGDEVFAGTLNGGGVLEIRVTRLAEDTTLAKIIQMVEQAQARKAPTQRFLEEFEPRYATGVVLTAIALIVVPTFILGHPFDTTFYRAMTFLVVASPCALVISTPASILSAIANAARNGILFKGGAYLEQAATIDAIAFDKTGTLTYGRPKVTAIVPATEVLGEAWFDSALLAQLQPKGVDAPLALSREEVLRLAASAERYSEHPLGEAIVAAAQEAGLPLADPEDAQAVVGKGLVARIEGQEVRIGNRKMADEAGELWPMPLQLEAHRLEQEGNTVVYVSVDGHPVGLIALADTIREDARATIEMLRAIGVKRIVMLTGDSRRVAKAVAREVGIVEVYAELLPQDKVALVERLAQESHVAMVGDGVNDAPAMAVSHLGIAMGAAGTDVALETADVVLMSDDLTKIPYLVGLARRARRIVWQNIAFSLAVIVVLVASVFIVNLPLPLGVVGHEGSTLIVVANGLRLLRTPREKILEAATTTA
nr:heavy metal translocating P-type ATPase [Ardenticatena sp.]